QRLPRKWRASVLHVSSSCLCRRPRSAMSSLDAMLDLLIKVMREPVNRKASVKQYQALVWACPSGSIDKQTYDAFADFAHDLGFFGTCPVLGRESPDSPGPRGRGGGVGAAPRWPGGAGRKDPGRAPAPPGKGDATKRHKEEHARI